VREKIIHRVIILTAHNICYNDNYAIRLRFTVSTNSSKSTLILPILIVVDGGCLAVVIRTGDATLIGTMVELT
jgi:hypothetical protein